MKVAIRKFIAVVQSLGSFTHCFFAVFFLEIFFDFINLLSDY
jgi:hypothetical protein